jgi:hypothetical protein
MSRRSTVPEFNVGDQVNARVNSDAITPWRPGIVARKLSRGRGALCDVRLNDGPVLKELTYDNVRKMETMPPPECF